MCRTVLVSTRRAAVWFLTCAIPASAWADLPSPRLDVIRPVGVSAGGTVELVIEGPDLEGTETLVFGHPGLTATLVKEKTFQLKASDGMPIGTYDVFASGRFGISSPRLLHVSHGLTDVAEVEPNNTPAMPQNVVLNVAINGQADGNNQDVYRFPLKQGQRVTIDCLSARLETEMDATLTLFATDGRRLASNADYYGRDPLIDFLAPADGEYLVEVRDLTYRGGYPYRLLIHDRPRVENVFPRAVQAGQTARLTVLGTNLPGGQSSSWSINDLPLQQATTEYAAPNDVLPLGLFRFRQHPMQHSVLPTAATCTVIGEQILPFEADPCVMVVTESPPSVEQEPNNSKDQTQALTLPTVVSGRFDQPRDADWYSFETDDMGGGYGFDVYAERIDGRCDPYLALYNDKGDRIQELDDFGHRMNAFDGHLRDPSGMVNLGGKQKIRVLVQDRYQRGGARTQYVLSIRKANPDFFAASIHSSTNAAGTTLRQGGAEYVDIILHHEDGATKYPVTISAEGLPPGVSVMPTVITNNTRGSVVFVADEGAAPFTGPVRLIATSKQDDREIRRVVRPYTRAYQQTGSRPMREQLLAVRDRAPYALRIEPERISVEAGKSVDVKLVVRRYWNEFQNPVNFQPLGFPGQFQLGNGTIGSDSTEKTVTIAVQAGTQPGDYTLAVLGQAQVPFHKDPMAKEKPQTLVSTPSRPITITVTAPPK